jgi:hypothetical protein
VLKLQSLAGNAAVSALMRRSPEGGSSGVPVPHQAAAARSLLGPLAGAVRVRQGADADRRLAERPAALAMTDGLDIHLSSRAPALDSPSGRLLLAHESAHVVQQTVTATEVGPEAAEAEADMASVQASLGRSIGPLSAAHGPQYFEAPKHAATLKTAMDAHGFSDAEQDAAYFGNWCRDLSQALVPTLVDNIGQNATFQVVNLLAIRHFGHGVTPAQLGAYSPQEHIDNPAGTTDRDIAAPDKQRIAGYSGTDPITGTDAGVATVSGIDPSKPGENPLSPENIAKSFAVDAAGIPEYINRSKRYILGEFEQAAKHGRTRAGLFHLGNLSHTCEDLFAHSNWVEIAVGRLIREDKITIPKEVQGDIKERLQKGQPPVEDYAAQAVDKAGNTRPILATGTFTGGSGLGNKAGHDTFISLAEEMKNLVRELNPFAESEGGASNWDFLMEILNHMDAAGDEGSLGPIMLGVMEPVLGSVDEIAGKVTAGVDGLEGKARGVAGEGVLGDLAAGAAGLVSSGVHAAVDPTAATTKEGIKKVILTATNQIGSGGVSLAKLAVWYQKAEGAIADAWKSLKDGVRGLPAAIRELILPKLVEAERNFRKEVKNLGTALYNKATQTLLAEIQKAAKPTQVKETNVQHKFLEWAKELSTFMVDKLKKVGGDEGARLAQDIPKGETAEEVPKLIAYAETGFPDTLLRLLGAAKADAVLAESAKERAEQVNHLKQLQNVPEWARAGASHSQLAKDHASSPFFGIAFKVANEADRTLVGWMKKTWGDGGPSQEDGLGKNYGEKETVTDAEGNKVTRQKVGKDGRPVLRDEEGLSEWEKEARKKFLENRMEGEETAKKGLAPEQTIGNALVGIVGGLKKVVAAYPVLGPALGDAITAMEKEPAGEELLKRISQAEKSFDAYAKSGKLDDAVMDQVDSLLGRGKAVVVRFVSCPHEHDHRNDKPGEKRDPHAHPPDCKDPNHGKKSGKPAEDPHDHKEDKDHKNGDHDHDHEDEGGDVHTAEQIKLLDKYRGVDPQTKKARGVEVDRLNDAVKVGEKAAADVKTESITDPKARFAAEVDRIFGHPYDTNWWVDIVQKWADANQHVLGQYIKDRNSGKAHVH